MNNLLLIIASGPCRDEGVKEFKALQPGAYDTCCINETGLWHIGPFRYWVSSHSDKLLEWAKIKPNSGAELWSYRQRPNVNHAHIRWDGGSSTFVAVQFGLFTWEYQRIVVVGAPLTGGNEYGEYGRFLPAWEKLNPEFLHRVRSMSGETAKILGNPDKEFVSVFDG